MKDFSIIMALVDFIPVVLFAVAAIVLQRDLYNVMSKGAFALFAAGTINVIVAGAAKATYKLLYAMQLCDFKTLDNIFFPLQSVGFLLAGIGMVAMLRGEKKTTLRSVAPIPFLGTPIFVTCMVFGVLLIDVCLSILASKLQKKLLIGVFLLSFLLELTMGYLSSRDFAQAAINWCVQGINIGSQGLFLVGAMRLRKAGMEKLFEE